MKRLSYAMVVLTMVGVGLASSSTTPTYNDQVIHHWIQNTTGFEENLGQVTNLDGKPVPEVLYRAKLPGYNIFLTENGVSIVFYAPEKNEIHSRIPEGLPEHTKPTVVHFARFDIIPEGGEIHRQKVRFEDPLSGVSNYYLAHCPDGILGVRTYRKVVFEDVYPGVDWVWKVDGGIHHEFVVHPGADLSEVRLKVKWADVKVSEKREEVSFSTPIGILKDGELMAWEEESGEKVFVRYRVEGGNVLTFEAEGYRGDRTLVIDPPLALEWATYYGGSDWDYGYSVAVEPNGNVFVTGGTWSTDFPTYDPGCGAYYDGTFNGGYDVFILRFTNAGVRQWATYYGGSDWDYGYSIAVEPNGNVFVTGGTSSTDFPTYDPGGGAYYDGTFNGNGDVFILKFQQATDVAEDHHASGEYQWFVPALFGDHITLQFRSRVSDKINLSLFNVVGRLILNHEVKLENTSEFIWRAPELTKLPFGVYVLEVKTQTRNRMFTLVKVR